MPDFDIQRLLTVSEIETNTKIDPATSLIIFDEIQEAPKVLTALNQNSFC